MAAIGFISICKLFEPAISIKVQKHSVINDYGSSWTAWVAQLVQQHLAKWVEAS